MTFCLLNHQWQQTSNPPGHILNFGAFTISTVNILLLVTQKLPFRVGFPGQGFPAFENRLVIKQATFILLILFCPL